MIGARISGLTLVLLVSGCVEPVSRYEATNSHEVRDSEVEAIDSDKQDTGEGPNARSFVAGRDYWPHDVSTYDFRILPESEVHPWAVVDAVVTQEGEVQVAVMYQGSMLLAPYDLVTGKLAIDEAITLLTPSSSPTAPDFEGLANTSMAQCRPIQNDSQPLTWDVESELWRLPGIGVEPDSIEFNATSKTGPDCAPRVEAWFPGQLDGEGVRTTDGLVLSGIDDCASPILVSYASTTCSLEDDAAWHCPLDATGDVVGACKWFMIYEAQKRLGDNIFARMLLLAHAAELKGPWLKHSPTGGAEPGPDDVVLRSSPPHNKFDSDNPDLDSFASAPDLWWDPVQEVWRLWFVAEVGADSGPATRSTESHDDGLHWGIERSQRPVECWSEEAGTWDTTVCEAMTWDLDAEPPDDPNTDRSPEVVDVSVITFPGESADSSHVLSIFAGANTACQPEPKWTGYLFGEHDNGGAGGSGWRWWSDVLADPERGVSVSADRLDSECNIQLHDFTVLVVKPDQFLLFFQPLDLSHGFLGSYVVGSGFECSNYVDDDGDGRIDFGEDPDCLSPTHDDEG